MFKLIVNKFSDLSKLFNSYRYFDNKFLTFTSAQLNDQVGSTNIGKFSTTVWR